MSWIWRQSFLLKKSCMNWTHQYWSPAHRQADCSHCLSCCSAHCCWSFDHSKAGQLIFLTWANRGHCWLISDRASCSIRSGLWSISASVWVCSHCHDTDWWQARSAHSFPHCLCRHIDCWPPGYTFHRNQSSFCHCLLSNSSGDLMSDLFF